VPDPWRNSWIGTNPAWQAGFKQTRATETPLRFLRQTALATIIALTATAAHALPYSNIYIFGDSLSDSGNNYLVFQNAPAFPPPLNGLNAVPTPRPDPVITTPTPLPSSGFIPSFPYAPAAPYPFGTYSNGPTWAIEFGAALGIAITPSFLGGNNFAYGGATTSGATPFPPSLSTQVDQFVARPGPADPDALYVIAGGGNNARAVLEAIQLLPPALALATIATAAAQYAADTVSMITRLQNEGADDIIVWNVPNVALAPAIALGGPQSQLVGLLTSVAMNLALAQALAAPSIAPDVRLFDLFGLVTSAYLNPSAFGFTNVTDACGFNPVACTNPNTWLFWDGIHPTSGGHALIAQGMLALVPVPATVPLFAIGIAAVWLVRRRRD
jgi:outer membrane lipase/esterase